MVENTPSESDYKYWAFISYSHSDAKWGEWLHKSLESYRLPRRFVGKRTIDGRLPRRLFPVFRDQEELPTSSDLGAVIRKALASSRYLVVVCSPHSANSEWVNQEVLEFKRLGRSDRILTLIVDGEPNTSDQSFLSVGDCFCPALRHQVDDKGNLTKRCTEPIAADIRPGKNGRRLAKLKLIAGLFNVDFDQLWRRENRRRLARVTYYIIGLVIAVGVAGTLWFQVEQDRKAAALEASRQESLRFAEESLRHTQQGRTTAGIRLALAGLPELSEKDRPLLIQVEAALYKAVFAHRKYIEWQERVSATGTPQFNSKGSRIITFTNNTAKIWKFPSGKLLGTLLAKDYVGKTYDNKASSWKPFRATHFSWISGVEFNHIGDRIITWNESEVRLWNAKTYEELKVIRNQSPENEICRASFILNGKHFAIAWEKSRIEIYDSDLGERIKIISLDDLGPSERGLGLKDLLYAALDRTGRFIASAHRGGKVILWDVNTCQKIGTLEDVKMTKYDRESKKWIHFGNKAHSSAVFGLAFSPRENVLITFNGNLVKSWKYYYALKGRDKLILNSELISKILHDKGDVDDVKFSPSGRRVAIVFSYGDIWLTNKWLTFDGLRTISVHRGGIRYIEFSLNGKLILAVSKQGSVRVWDTVTGSQLFVLGILDKKIKYAKFSPDSQHIITQSNDGYVTIWKVSLYRTVVEADFDQKERFSRDPDSLWRNPIIAIDPKELKVVYGVYAKRAQLIDFATGKFLAELHTDGGNESDRRESIGYAEFHPNGKLLLTLPDMGGSFRNPEAEKASLWDVESGKEVSTLTHPSDITLARFTPDGSRLFTGTDKGLVRIWDSASYELLITLKAHEDSISALDFSPDGMQFLTGSDDKTAKLWSERDGKLLREFRGHLRGVNDVTFAPDGNLIATAGSDNSVRVWDAKNGEELAVLRGSNDWYVYHVGFDSSMKYLKAVWRNGDIRIWNVRKYKLITVIRIPGEYLRLCKFIEHGKRLLTAPSDGIVRIWDVESGMEMASIPGHEVVMLHRHKKLLVAHTDHSLTVWPYYGAKEELIDVARNIITPSAINRDGN